MKILNSAAFTTHQIKSGGSVIAQVTWTSDADGTLGLHYEADKFTIAPDHVALPADSAGSNTFTFTITHNGANLHCDVNFQFGDDHRVDTVDVT